VRGKNAVCFSYPQKTLHAFRAAVFWLSAVL
jgi:hypothetical protein